VNWFGWICYFRNGPNDCCFPLCGHYAGPDGLTEELGKGSGKNWSSQPQEPVWYFVNTSSRGSESIKEAEDLVLRNLATVTVVKIKQRNNYDMQPEAALSTSILMTDYKFTSIGP